MNGFISRSKEYQEALNVKNFAKTAWPLFNVDKKNEIDFGVGMSEKQGELVQKLNAAFHKGKDASEQLII